MVDQNLRRWVTETRFKGTWRRYITRD